MRRKKNPSLLRQAHFISTLHGIHDLTAEPGLIRGLRSLFWRTLDQGFGFQGPLPPDQASHLKRFIKNLQLENQIHASNLPFQAKGPDLQVSNEPDAQKSRSKE